MLALALCAAPGAAHALDSVLALANPTEAAGDRVAVSAGLRYFLANDPLAAREYKDAWGGPYHPRNGANLGLLSARAEVGAGAFGWRLSTLRRLDLLVESNRDTTDLIRLYKARGSSPAGQTFSVDVHYQGVEVSGWRIDKAWNWKSDAGGEIAFGVGYSRLEGRRVRVGSALGSITSLGSGDYSYAVGTDDAYTRKTYPFLTPGQAGGHGESFDLGVSLKTPQGYRLEAIANDVFARMRWHDIPGTVSTARTATTITDADGFIVYAPALAGRNARRDFVQKLPMRWAIAAEVPWRDFALLVSVSHMRGANFPLVGVAWRFGNGWRLQTDYDVRFKTIGLKLAHSIAFVALRSSQRNLSEAQAYGLSSGVSWTF